MAKKVFELAKELEIGALDLVEILKNNGILVRNHMSELSDEDVVRVQEIVSPPKNSVEPEKKKTVRKKAVKKESDVASSTKAAVASDKKAVVKKRTVIRRKAGEGDDSTTNDVSADGEHFEHEENDDNQNAASQEVVEDLTNSSQDLNQSIENFTDESRDVFDAPIESQGQEVVVDMSVEKTAKNVGGVGLRVISRPDKVQVEEIEQKKSEIIEAPKKEVQKTVYKEKTHKFTPIYIPSKDENNKNSKDVEVAPKEKTQAYTYMDYDDALDEDAGGRGNKDFEGGVGKKRLGGLASMMSGKAKGVAKTRDITELRAEEELKSYSALSTLGRPIYSQVKKKKVFVGQTAQTQTIEMKQEKKTLEFHKGSYASDLAEKLHVKFQNLLDTALEANLLLKPTDYLGMGLLEQVCKLYSFKAVDVSFKEEEIIQKTKGLSEEEKEKLPLRAPIVTIMGHVDHGKTTLLDYIRNAKVAQGEAGGITQHLGAYSVNVGEKSITFLDTPGHAAFGAIRQRGAKVTDIVVLVVAADDGVMPQTRESVEICQNAGVPIIVAVNKIDKEGVNPDKIKNGLTELNIVPEEWGGDTQFVPVSALKGTGVDNLLEAILIQAEMLELRADPKKSAISVVVESKLEIGRGPVVTAIVQNGTLNKGDSIVAGESYGRARSIMNPMGEAIDKAGPSTPVMILGLDSIPDPGQELYVVKNEREAKKIVENRITERKSLEAISSKQKLSLEDFFSQHSNAPAEGQKVLNLVIRSDVQGSYEAIKQSLESLSNSEVAVKIIGGGVGAITDSDVHAAAQAKGFVIGFNMRPVTTARRIAEEKGVDIKNYSIIYELINDITLAMEGLLEPEYTEEFVGRAEVRETFVVPKAGMIAGSLVIDGKILRGCSVRLLRDGKIMFDGKISSLRRFKDDVKEVGTGYECGIGLENFNDVKISDIFEAYNMIEKRRKLQDVKQ